MGSITSAEAARAGNAAQKGSGFSSTSLAAGGVQGSGQEQNWAHVIARREHFKRMRRRGFPPLYKRLSLIDKLKWLNDPECRRKVAAGELQFSQIEAECRRLQKRSAQISRIVPSPVLLEDFEHGQPFPPPVDDRTLRLRHADFMLSRCEEQMLWPAVYLTADGATYDRVLLETQERAAAVGLIGGKSIDDPRGGFTTSSPTAAAIHRMASAGAVEMKSALPPEDEQSLRREIAAAHVAAAGGKAASVQI